MCLCGLGLRPRGFLVPPGPGPGCQILVILGPESPSLTSGAQTSLANSCCGNLASHLPAHFREEKENLEGAGDWLGLSPADR